MQGLTYMSGGYCKIDKLVVINMRLNTNGATLPNGELIKGFPWYTANDNFVWVFNNMDKTIAISTHGVMYSSEPILGQLVVGCAYITD